MTVTARTDGTCLSGRRWAIGGALLFLVGVLFGHLMGPRVYREETVMVIGSSGVRGCEGHVGTTPVLFGMSRGNSDGVYRIACGARMRLSEDAQLVCMCPAGKSE